MSSSHQSDIYCIIHDTNPKKDSVLFNKALASLLGGSGKKYLSIRGGVFPPGFEFWKLFNSNIDLFSKGSREWPGVLDLAYSQFLGFVNFSTLIFKNYVILVGAKFASDVWIRDAIFEGPVNFSKARFNGEASIIGSEFNQEVSFAGVHFKDIVSFRGTTFRNQVVISKSTFEEKVEFIKTKFEGDTTFDQVHATHVDFGGSSFSKILFIGKPQDLLFAGSSIDLTDTTFERPDFARFSCVDFEKCNLLHTDVRGIDFSQVKWPESGWLFWKRKKVYIPEKEKFYRTELETLYRQIRQSYEERGNYPDAGDFYFGEMDQKRKKNWARRYFPCLTTLYWLSSGYGQRPLQAAIIFLFLICASTIISLHLGIDVRDNSPYSMDVNFFTVLWFHTIRTVTFNSSYFEPSNTLGSFLISFIRILVPIQIALLILAINRKFKR